MSRPWGIDVEGRMMWYDAWPVDDTGSYRMPSEEEIHCRFAVPGQTFVENLTFFDFSETDAAGLIDLLNCHATDSRFYITREQLYDRERRYSNEYYFYFIMFIKKMTGDYNAHVSNPGPAGLTGHHRPFEMGFLKHTPWGLDSSGRQIKESGGLYIAGGILYVLSLLDSDKKEQLKEELVLFLKSVVPYSCKESISLDFLLMEYNWYSYETGIFIVALLSVFADSNNILEKIPVYYLEHTKSSVSSVIMQNLGTLGTSNWLDMVSKTSNTVCEHKRLYSDSNSFIFRVSYKKDFIEKYREFPYFAYSIFLTENSYKRGFAFILKRMLNLEKEAEVELLKPFNSFGDHADFYVKWERRVTGDVRMALLALLPLPLLGLAAFSYWVIPPVLLFSAVCGIAGFLFSKQAGIIDEQKKVLKSNLAYFQTSREILDVTTGELRLEKNTLADKVKERTRELEEAHKKLLEIGKARTAFFTNITHEFRTPLTNILSNIELAASGSLGEDVPVDHKIFDTLDANANRLLRLINNLLDYTRVDSFHYTLKPEKIDFSRFLEHCVAQVESSAVAKGLVINFIHDKISPFILIDVHVLETIIYNLLSNAIKFTSRGSVTLSARIDRMIILSVRDTGQGIAKEEQERIFEIFAQARGNTYRKQEGSGIGLALVKKMVQLAGGELELDSTPGAGSTFTVTLPYCEAAAEQSEFYFEKGRIRAERTAEAAAPCTMDNSCCTLLVVEDNRDMRDLIVTLFRNSYHVETAANGEEAVKKLFAMNRPDLIISDIMMPVMSGNEFCEFVRSLEDFAHIPIIFLTARDNKEERITSLNGGVIDYICKPFNNDELIARVRALIENRKKIADYYKNKLTVFNKQHYEKQYDSICAGFKLTNQERRVVKLLNEGNEYKIIAQKLFISINTVKKHTTRIYEKCRVAGRSELLTLFTGLTGSDDPVNSITSPK